MSLIGLLLVLVVAALVLWAASQIVTLVPEAARTLIWVLVVVVVVIWVLYALFGGVAPRAPVFR